MAAFVFQPGGGADAAYTHACITRAYHAAKGQLEQRDEVITTIQAHPCNAATAAAAGFKVVTLPLEEDGYPSVEALEAAISDRTAALMVNNPDDMGVYNPHIKRWVELVHEAGGLAFYDHANFNGVMGRIRARELGFDACMYMLHKTFGAPKGGGGPAVGAYGCSEELVEFLPRPLVHKDGDRYTIERDAPSSIGRVREYWGNVPVVVKAYSWARAMGAEGIKDAADLSVLANNYMEKRLLQIRGVTRSHPDATTPRLEMTRYSLEQVTQRHRHQRLRHPEPDGRLRDRRVLAQPRAVAAARAVHPRAGRAVVQGGHRPLDRRARARDRRGLQRPGDRQDRAAQPGDPPGRRLARERARALGDDVARAPAQSGGAGVRVAVVGGGSIGVGWAVVFARAGFDVAVHEPDAARREAVPREVEERGGGPVTVHADLETRAGRRRARPGVRARGPGAQARAVRAPRRR